MEILVIQWEDWSNIESFILLNFINITDALHGIKATLRIFIIYLIHGNIVDAFKGEKVPRSKILELKKISVALVAYDMIKVVYLSTIFLFN